MKILLAGGGTAGHIEPALAVARALQEKNSSTECVFIGTPSGLENTLIPQAGFTLSHIPKVSIPRSLSPALLKVPFQLISAVSATARLLKGVDCAIGFGGYVSGPLYLAAALTRTPFVIHEQNAKPGWANRMGSYLTKRVAVSYSVARGRLSKAALTGLPLRRDVMSIAKLASSDWAKARKEAKTRIAKNFSVPSEQPLVFIFGGSQGSLAINQVIGTALDSLADRGISIIHGVGGKNELPEKRSYYTPLHYIEDMADLYLAADLIIARSGAVTCAEFQALGRFALFIPLPVGNGEQALNAAGLVNAGRAEIVAQKDFTPSWLTSHFDELLHKSGGTPLEGDLKSLNSADMICELIESAVGDR